MGVDSNGPERFHFLDGFRGAATALVVFAHAFMANILRLPILEKTPFISALIVDFLSCGLDMFFVLSGMVILRPYLRRERSFKVGNYVSRRMKRLYPPYFFALLFGWLAVWIIRMYPSWYNVLWVEITPWEFFKEALILNFDGYYFNLAWWSLNIEIVFYVLVPFIIAVFPAPEKLTKYKLWTILFIGLGCTLTIQFLSSQYAPNLFSYRHIISNVGMFINFPMCFLMGAFLATKDFDIKDGYRFLTLGIVLIIIAAIYIPSLHVRYFPLAHTAYGIFSAGLITIGFNSKPFRNFWSKPGMIWLGERSYSLYLVHLSVFYLTDNFVAHFTTERNFYYGVFTRLIFIPVSVFASMLLFSFVERRFAHGLVTDKIFWPWQLKRLNLGGKAEK